MENFYGVGTTNRYALFLEEGENSLTAIRRKINKETRVKDKQTKKENAEAKKVEVEVAEKPKKSDPKPVQNDVSPPKKELKEKKVKVPKSTDKKPSDNNVNRKGKEPDKLKSKNENSSQENELKDDASKSNDTGNARKNYENRRGPKKFDDQKSPPPSNKRSNKENDWNIEGSGDSPAERYHEDNRNVKENGHGPYNDVKPRGGRFSKGNRGGRNNFGGGDRRKDFDMISENKDEFDANKNETNGEEKAENILESDKPKDDDKGTDGEGNDGNEQKEVKEYMTLDEWKKLRGTRQKPQYNLRKAGEGEDLTQWKNMKELKKDEEFIKNGSAVIHVQNNHENEEENSGNENTQRVARQKHIDINVHFRDAPVRGRGGRLIRSNRFGYKGSNFDHIDNFGGESRSFRKNRDGPGRGGSRQHAPKMDDENAFPSLG